MRNVSKPIFNLTRAGASSFFPPLPPAIEALSRSNGRIVERPVPMVSKLIRGASIKAGRKPIIPVGGRFMALDGLGSGGVGVPASAQRRTTINIAGPGGSMDSFSVTGSYFQKPQFRMTEHGTLMPIASSPGTEAKPGMTPGSVKGGVRTPIGYADNPYYRTDQHGNMLFHHTGALTDYLRSQGVDPARFYADNPDVLNGLGFFRRMAGAKKAVVMPTSRLLQPFSKIQSKVSAPSAVKRVVAQMPVKPVMNRPVVRVVTSPFMRSMPVFTKPAPSRTVVLSRALHSGAGFGELGFSLKKTIKKAARSVKKKVIKPIVKASEKVLLLPVEATKAAAKAIKPALLLSPMAATSIPVAASAAGVKPKEAIKLTADVMKEAAGDLVQIPIDVAKQKNVQQAVAAGLIVGGGAALLPAITGGGAAGAGSVIPAITGAAGTAASLAPTAAGAYQAYQAFTGGGGGGGSPTDYQFQAETSATPERFLPAALTAGGAALLYFMNR